MEYYYWLSLHNIMRLLSLHHLVCQYIIKRCPKSGVKRSFYQVMGPGHGVVVIYSYFAMKHDINVRNCKAVQQELPVMKVQHKADRQGVNQADFCFVVQLTGYPDNSPPGQLTPDNSPLIFRQLAFNIKHLCYVEEIYFYPH